MIFKIAGKLVEKREQSLVINVHGHYYEVMVPTSVLGRVEETLDANGDVHLITYYYFQITPASGLPVLIGFITEIERDFFLQFIKVSGIGPKAAVKALNQPISDITRAIEGGDMAYLKTLPGIGLQRAKEIIAKLQGKIGKFGLIQDRAQAITASGTRDVAADWQQEAFDVLLQLQYKRPEALAMIQKSLEHSPNIQTAEDLLNDIYKHKVKG